MHRTTRTQDLPPRDAHDPRERSIPTNRSSDWERSQHALDLRGSQEATVPDDTARRHGQTTWNENDPRDKVTSVQTDLLFEVPKGRKR